MEEMKTTTEIIMIIMMVDPDTRNNDNLLYLRVLSALGEQHDIGYLNMRVVDFFRLLPQLDVPTIETVSRIRRKLQQKYPALQSTKKIKNHRAEREKMFRQFAKG